MLSQVEEAQNKWGGAHSAIDCWLSERQKLLVEYCELAGLPPFERQPGALPDSQSIKGFCERLMDYVSTGHFEVYDKIVTQNHSQDVKLTEELFPKIAETTQDALTFNDAFADISDDSELSMFDAKLSSLGQRLEERFELEDRLINTLHNNHL